MRRLEIQIRRRDGPEDRIVLNRFASLVATLVLAALAIAVVVLAVLFGYLVIGLVLAGLDCDHRRRLAQRVVQYSALAGFRAATRIGAAGSFAGGNW